MLSLITPAVWGNGYSVVQSYLLSPPLFSVIIIVFVCKLLAVLASSGSGAPGGVFTLNAIRRAGNRNAIRHFLAGCG